MSECPSVEVPSLRLLQETFWALLRAPTGVVDAVQALPQHAGLLAHIVSDRRGSAVNRLELYANMYFYRLRDNLAQDFPKLVRSVNEANFHNLITDYLHACPSQEPNARYVGQRLPHFLRDHSLSWESPWLSDLAALEWARIDLAERADERVLTREDLQTAATHGFADLTLFSIAAHTLLPVQYAVDVCWRALHHEQPLSSPLALEQATLLVWREPDLRVHHRRLFGAETQLWPRLSEGLSFLALCEHFMAKHEPSEAARQSLALVASWTCAGLLRASSP